MYGVLNLEAPVFAVEGGGLVILVTPVVRNISTLGEDVDVEFDLPLHLRYGVPFAGGFEGMDEGMVLVSIPLPTPFFACQRLPGGM